MDWREKKYNLKLIQILIYVKCHSITFALVMVCDYI